jgi:hypothetical protein
MIMPFLILKKCLIERKEDYSANKIKLLREKKKGRNSNVQKYEEEIKHG